MHRFIAIYGSAAHLALVAMSPLFLYPFFGATAVAVALFAVLPLTLAWFLMEPSVYAGEMPHDARARVLSRLRSDPFFWLLLAITVYALIVAVNGGVAYVYDVEKTIWRISSPKQSFLPGSVDAEGWMPAAQLAEMAVAVLAVRHAYGQYANCTFLMAVSLVSGLSGFLWLFLGVSRDFIAAHDGTVFGLALIAASVATLRAFEQRLSGALPVLTAAFAGNLVGLVAFAPAHVAVVMLALWLVLSLWSVIRLRGRSPFFGGVGYPLVWFASVLVAYLLLSSLAAPVLAGRVQTCASMSFFDESVISARALLAGCARSAWMDSPWLGSGYGSFEAVMRGYLRPDDWTVVAAGGFSAVNGWWRVLVEGGIVRLAAMAVPFAFLLFRWGRTLVAAAQSRKLVVGPVVIAGPLALAVLAALPFFGQISVSVESYMVALVLMVVSGRVAEAMTKGVE